MTGLTCMAVRQRLAAFHDDELPVQEQIAVQGHLYDCRACRDELHDGYHSVSDALRLAAAPGPADDWTGLQPGVISRMRVVADAMNDKRTNGSNHCSPPPAFAQASGATT